MERCYRKSFTVIVSQRLSVAARILILRVVDFDVNFKVLCEQEFVKCHLHPVIVK